MGDLVCLKSTSSLSYIHLMKLIRSSAFSVSPNPARLDHHHLCFKSLTKLTTDPTSFHMYL